MYRIFVPLLVAVSLFIVSASNVHAWGRGGGGGGGYRGGGGSAGGFHAAGVSGGGYHAAGVSAGGYRAGEVGGYHAGGVSAGGYRAGEVGGFRAGGFEAAGVQTHMATDFGFGRVAGVGAGRGFVTAGHYTAPYSGGVLAARGAAVRHGFYQYGAFNAGWWGAHPGAWRPYGWNAAYGWGWATWPGLNTWFGWSAQPVYYDYGNTITYQGDQVILDGQPGPTAAEYYQQAADLAQSASPIPPPEKKENEWQPLGVFSLVQGEQSDTSAVFQLAVNKAGIIRGNYYNVLTNNTLPVSGAVDRKTQRASWIVGDQKDTVYDTGIFNLTKDQSPVLIHFGKERTQQWLLVRIEENDGKAPVTPMDVPPAPPQPTSARLTIQVPADAEVYFDGHLTTQTGTSRVFVSPPLQEGKSYSYSIRARWTRDGTPIEQTRTVAFQAASKVLVDFTSPLP